MWASVEVVDPGILYSREAHEAAGSWTRKELQSNHHLTSAEGDDKAK